MKTLFRCEDCGRYSLKKIKCKECGGIVDHPYPARFSIIKETKFRRLYSKENDD